MDCDCKIEKLKIGKLEREFSDFFNLLIFQSFILAIINKKMSVPKILIFGTDNKLFYTYGTEKLLVAEYQYVQTPSI
jgi:hypothetical protein